MSKAHSKLGASAAQRWMNCPGSNNLIAQLLAEHKIEIKSGPHADLGTAAHELAEYCLLDNADPVDYVGQRGPVRDGRGRLVITKKENIDEEMAEAVTVYLDYVRDRVREGGRLHVETKFDLGNLYPGMFGTSDAVIYNDVLGTLEVIDYKHGVGIAVSPERNPQAMFYGLGALSSFDNKNHVDKVILTIVQPRAMGAPIKTWITTPQELHDFGKKLVESAKKTRERNAPLVAGDWCEKTFCAARGLCPKLKEKAYEVAKVVFDGEGKNMILPEPKLLSLEEVKEVLDFSSTLEKWLKSVEYFAFELASNGIKVPGYKLVKKQARRQWRDELEARIALQGVTNNIYTEPKLKSPAQIEALKVDKAFVASLCETPDTGNTLAPESDKRQEVEVLKAVDVFADHNPLN